MAEQRRARQIEVADRVEYLVTHELVDVAQAFLVQHAVAGNDHGVVERAAARQTSLAHALDLVEEAEGPRGAEFVLERGGAGRKRQLLAPDGAGGEIDGEADGKPIARRQHRRLAGRADGDRL